MTEHEAELYFEFSIDNEENTKKLLQVKKLRIY